MTATTLLWIRRTMLAVFVTFLLVASIGPKLVHAKVATDSLTGLGWEPQSVMLLGLMELGCLVVFLVPRTRLVGAVLMTAFLGGTVATHLRVGSPILSHTLFGVYLGLLMWGAVLLQDPDLRKFLQPRAG